MNDEDYKGQPEGWTRYQKLVLADLERHSKALDHANDQLSSIRIEIAMLKVKSGIWGLMGGLIPVVVALAIELYYHK